MYDFDKTIIRRGSGCLKWDECPADDVIPLWVADMDFAVAPAIQKALEQRVAHGVFGYTHVDDDYFQAVISWFGRRHHWPIRRQEIVYTTGVVPALSATLQALTMPGEQVLMLSPDYNCFFSSIRNSGCQVLESVLVREGDTFSIDYDDIEAKCSLEKTTVLLLCNPHNPTGRVWTRDELLRLNDICLRHGVIVVSDEIHCELIMPGYTFQPFATVSDECRRNSVVLNSPSKAFNIAGLQIANIVCANKEWLRRIDRAVNINEVCDVNPFGPIALQAAYNESEDWLDELRDYLAANYQALCEYTAREMPALRVCRLEGTYLPWIDVSQTGLPADVLCRRLLTEARVWVNPGTMYGSESGQGYVRLNIACPRATLMEGLRRISAFLNAER